MTLHIRKRTIELCALIVQNTFGTVVFLRYPLKTFYNVWFE